MAVSTRTIFTQDNNSGRKGTPCREVHYIKVRQNNRKGSAACIGGTLVDHLNHRSGLDFHINLVTRVNSEYRMLKIWPGDVVFRTGDSNRWQVMSLRGFRKRFPNAKI